MLGTATNSTSRTFVDTANPSKREKEGVETVSCGRSGDKKRVVKRDGSPGFCSRALLAGHMQASAVT